ncbi:MAG TPA: hypothetical protein VFK05_15680 [Polyangiaceae bacterium]|nr:hypothetical protein [Polyangiaceae bacterium]
MASIHDSLLVGYLVDGRAQIVVLQTRPNKGDGGAVDVKFSGVAAYHFESDCLENIVLEIVEVSADIIVGDGAAFVERNRMHGWPRDWDCTRETPKQFFQRQGCRCFQLSCSYGMSGWIAAQEIELLAVPSP